MLKCLDILNMIADVDGAKCSDIWTGISLSKSCKPWSINFGVIIQVFCVSLVWILSFWLRRRRYEHLECRNRTNLQQTQTTLNLLDERLTFCPVTSDITCSTFMPKMASRVWLEQVIMNVWSVDKRSSTSHRKYQELHTYQDVIQLTYQSVFIFTTNQSLSPVTITIRLTIPAC